MLKMFIIRQKLAKKTGRMMEAAYPPLHIRYCWLAGKCLLKCSFSSSLGIVDIFCAIWRFVRKFMSLLASQIPSLNSAINFIKFSPKLPLYNLRNSSHFFSLYFLLKFSFLQPQGIKVFPPHVDNNLFC